MSIKIPEILGEGTYGCVHGPSLKCKNNETISYKNKVSKTLSTKDSTKELKEYKNVIKADKKKNYYLGTPDICDIDNRSFSNLKAIQKCKIGSEVLKDLSKYKLLIMNDGGINLENYTKKMRNWSVSEMSTELCEKFLLESLRLFKGLKTFEEHGLIHHDLKPQNIVYNEVTNRLNFIDFGLMTSREKIMKAARTSNYDFALFHWSFPWEYEFINRKEYNNVVTFPENQEEIISEINDEIKKKNGKFYEHIKTFFYYALDNNTSIEKYQSSCQNYLAGYRRTLTDNMIDMGYEKFLEASVRTNDVYGLGIALNHWFHNAKKFLTPSINDELSTLYSKMITSDIKYRPFIKELMKEMEEILNKNGLLEKYNKKIVDHIVIDSIEDIYPTFDLPPSIFEKVVKPNDKIALTDPDSCHKGMIMNIKGDCVKGKHYLSHCPEGKERNPITRRCVIKCKPGYVRNDKFKCIKIKQPNVVIDKTNTPCPEGKERNPKTRRCIAKCKPGYVRNDDFKCVKNKTVKLQQ